MYPVLRWNRQHDYLFSSITPLTMSRTNIEKMILYPEVSFIFEQQTCAHQQSSWHDWINPSNAKATFVQGKRMRRFLKTILPLAYWYSLDSSDCVLLDDVPYARVSVISQFWPHFVLVKLATSSRGVKSDISMHFEV